MEDGAKISRCSGSICGSLYQGLWCLTNHVETVNRKERTVHIAYRLSLQVKELDEINKPAKASALVLLGMLKEINLRVQDEESWVAESSVYLHALFKKFLDTSLEIGKLQDQAFELKSQIAQFILRRPNSCAFYELIKTLDSVELCVTNSTLQLKHFGMIHHEMKITESMLNGKMRYLRAFAKHQQAMMEILKKISPVLSETCTKIDNLVQMYGLTVVDHQFLKESLLSYDEDVFRSLEDLAFDFCFSWRKRRFHNRPILPPVRDQFGGSTCSYHATLTCVESLYKREYAACPTILKDQIGQPDEFIINLSRNQLQDIVEDFYARHSIKKNKKLNVCLEKMKREGITSEEAYNNPHFQPDKRYKIKGYKEINLQLKKYKALDSELVGNLREEVQKIMKKPVGTNKSRKLLRRQKRKMLNEIRKYIMSYIYDGRVLIANFLVTTDYYRLLPHDIYRVPQRNAQYEVNKDSKPWSHCVVVVGFGIRKGECYLIYQNSYGTSWGDGDFGRIYFSSVKKLFLAHV